MKGRTVRVLKWAGVAMLVLGIVYAASLWLANRSLQQAYDALQADGRPMRLAEIIPPPVPEPENAALLYQAGILLLKAEGAEEQNLFKQLDDLASKVLDEPSTRVEQQFRKLADNNAVSNAMQLVEQATTRPHYRQDLDYSQGAALLLPHLTDMRTITRILCASAQIQSSDGDHNRAWNTAIVAMRVANALEKEPLLISQLVRLAQFRQAADTMQSLAEASPPSEEQEAEIRALLRPFDDIAPYLLALDGERLALGEWAFGLPPSQLRQNALIGESSSPLAVALLTSVRPLFRYDHAAYLRVMHAVTRNAEQPYSAEDPMLAETLLNEVPRYCVFTRMLTPAISRVKTRVTIARAQSRILRTGLSVLSYRREHGVFPETLNEAGIEQFTDPFSQRALIYRPMPTGFLVYSVGANMADDGGTTPAKEDDQHSGDVVWRYAE